MISSARLGQPTNFRVRKLRKPCVRRTRKFAGCPWLGNTNHFYHGLLALQSGQILPPLPSGFSVSTRTGTYRPVVWTTPPKQKQCDVPGGRNVSGAPPG